MISTVCGVLRLQSGLGGILSGRTLLAAPLPRVDPLERVTDHRRQKHQAAGQVERRVVASGCIHERT